ncbi:cyclin-D1-binding protein 1 isoform X2 [Phacochoerus africanus]|uniref:cyclin-D1-binding protein 1 isoform X2 n=1 Tax=Phacochoerus africanus TaxID=41426 RepID=UPI001FD89662|nr:cyclin-D1-binding protein 1 isoform X2 [Phacochoerus africanus]
MANAVPPDAPVPTLAVPSEQLRHLAEELRLLLPGVRVGEARETTKEFNPETFWRRFNEAAVTVSTEATTLTVVFSRLPLPSPQETQRFCEQVHAAIKAIIAAYYSLPKDQALRTSFPTTVSGMRARKCLKSQEAVEECDPYCGLLNDIEEDNSDNHGDEEGILGCPNNRDSYWSEEDQELIIPCLALVRASKACLKKIRLSVAENGKKDQVAQLDDIVDISDEISPSVDDLALSIYPPVCHLTVRLNAAKLVSVLEKALEITKASHVTPQPEDSWIPLLINAVDHCMNRIKELTHEVEL